MLERGCEDGTVLTFCLETRLQIGTTPFRHDQFRYDERETGKAVDAVGIQPESEGDQDESALSSPIRPPLNVHTRRPRESASLRGGQASGSFEPLVDPIDRPKPSEPVRFPATDCEKLTGLSTTREGDQSNAIRPGLLRDDGEKRRQPGRRVANCPERNRQSIEQRVVRVLISDSV